MQVRIKDRETVLDAFLWDGDREHLPEWMGKPMIEEDRHYGKLLHVEQYLVRVGSYVLRNLVSGHVFPVKSEHFTEGYLVLDSV